jgi:hypothetical protein
MNWRRDSSPLPPVSILYQRGLDCVIKEQPLPKEVENCARCKRISSAVPRAQWREALLWKSDAPTCVKLYYYHPPPKHTTHRPTTKTETAIHSPNSELKKKFITWNVRRNWGQISCCCYVTLTLVLLKPRSPCWYYFIVSSLRITGATWCLVAWYSHQFVSWSK